MLAKFFAKYKSFFILSFLVLGGLFLQADSAKAVGWDAKPGMLGAGVPWYGNNKACAAAQTGFESTFRIDFQDVPDSAAGYYVDFKRTTDFNDGLGHYYKFLPAGSPKYVDTDGTDFIPYNSPSFPQLLSAGYNYYIRVYNASNLTHYYMPGTAGIPICGETYSVTAQPSVSGTPGCAGAGGYTTGTVSWSGRYDHRLGFYVDISTENYFSTVWNKAVTGADPQSTSLSGFNGYQNAAGGLTLQGGTNYYVRVYNGGALHSASRQFSVPACTPPTCLSTSPNNALVQYGDNTHTVYVTTNNTTMVNFAVISPTGVVRWVGGIGDPYGIYRANLDMSTWPEYGAYTVDVYMGNANYPAVNIGCFSHPDFVREVPAPPTCTNVTPQGVVTYDEFGTHTVTVNGVHPSVTTVNIAVWSDPGGQDDLQWYEPIDPAPYNVQNLGGGTWRLTFNKASHLTRLVYGYLRIHAYMYNPFGSAACMPHADVNYQPRPAPTITSVTPNVTTPCLATGSYTVTVNWTGAPRPAGAPVYEGFHVDAGTDPNLNLFWNKRVSPTTFSTAVPTGFGAYPPNTGSLTLVPDVNYYFKVNNDNPSAIWGPVSVPRCGSLNIEEVNQTGGSWTLTKPGFTKAGTGARQFSPTACINDSYYCLPIGTYTLTPTPNSPAGYNGTADPTTQIVN